MKIFLKLLPMALLYVSCETSFLEAISDKNKVIPQSLEDFQALLDNTDVMNTFSAHRTALIAVDEYTINDTRWGLLTSEYEKNVHTWTNYGNVEVDDWNNSYKRILYTNIVLEGLDRLDNSSKQESKWSNIKGAALFFRAMSFFELSQLFCRTYDASTAAVELGLPLKIMSNIEEIPQRATLQETYRLIVDDIKMAIEILPEEGIIKERPTALAAIALLSRVYLYMGDYENSLKYALIALERDSQLLDYNVLNLTARYPFARRGIGNNEVIFMCKTGASSILNSSTFNAAQKFLDYYQENDLRKQAFFFNNADGRKLFKGSYAGEYQVFTGLSVNEIYLIAAECSIRLHQKNDAIEYMNILRRNRYSGYVNLTHTDFESEKEILELVLLERRRELYRRGLLWGDLKRLNHEGVFVDKLQRMVNGEKIELLPDNKIYTWPIPHNVVELSGIEQN